MAGIEISTGILETLRHIPPGAFSTYDFILAFQRRCPDEWRALELAYGVGGKGAGQHSTAYTRIAQTLNKLAMDKKLTKLDYDDAPDNWGNAIIRYWTLDPDQTAREKPPTADPEFREGSPKLRQHLRRERHWGLGKRKKAEFVAEHGRLFCERCKLEPVQAFGALGDSVIEVHHAALAVGKMGEGHMTRLSELECLCANCHRLAHAEISAEGS